MGPRRGPKSLAVGGTHGTVPYVDFRTPQGLNVIPTWGSIGNWGASRPWASATATDIRPLREREEMSPRRGRGGHHWLLCTSSCLGWASIPRHPAANGVSRSPMPLRCTGICGSQTHKRPDREEPRRQSGSRTNPECSEEVSWCHLVCPSRHDAVRLPRIGALAARFSKLGIRFWLFRGLRPRQS